MKTYSDEDFKRWGRKGARQRAKKTTPEQRSEIARNAARARWGLVKVKK